MRVEGNIMTCEVSKIGFLPTRRQLNQGVLCNEVTKKQVDTGYGK